jgi:uncharacterized protein (TIGR00106 family)
MFAGSMPVPESLEERDVRPVPSIRLELTLNDIYHWQVQCPEADMIIAQLTVVPVGTGTASLSKFVAGFENELKRMGFEPRLSAMSTVIEADSIDRILAAIKRLHEMVFENGALRALTSVSIDERRDKEGSIKQKIRSVESKM